MRISLDTETTGLDVRHGCLPFFVTICVDNGEPPVFWEWDVDPLTRIPKVPANDLLEIWEYVESADEIDLQNAKFDVSALNAIWGRTKIRKKFDWPWDKTHDLLLSAHLIESNGLKDLTTQALKYLRVDIEPLELAVVRACNEARRFARFKLKNWRIAKKDLPELPSAGGTLAKLDMWLPRAIAKHQKLPKDHDWWTIPRDYANADSAVTLHLREAHKAIIQERNLDKIYEVRRKIPRINYLIEDRGVSVSKKRTHELTTEFSEITERTNKFAIKLAGEGPCLDCRDPEKVPKKGCKRCGGTKRAPLIDKLSTGVSNALRYTVFEHFGLSSPFRTDSGGPAMNKEAMEYWTNTLPPRSKQALFIKSLGDFRKRATALTYMNNYQRFGRTTLPGWWIIHPSLNPTGSNTLRWTSSNPNEQNISKKEGANIRYTFGPLPGREWWSLDAKNIELRIPAYESGEQELVDLFERPDEPPFYGSNHMLIFATLHEEMWNDVLRKVGPEKVASTIKKMYASTWYQWTKNGNFAVQYGAVESSGTADAAYHVPGAQRMIASRFQKQQALNQKCIDFAEEFGYVETMPDRTVDPERGYPLICTKTEWGGILPTVPLNYHVQGTAMWWMMKAMIRCQEQLDEWNDGIKDVARDGYFMVMQVHDELVFDFPKGKTPKSNLPKIKRIKRLMEKGGDDLGLPTPVSCEYHPVAWSETTLAI